MFCGSTCEPPSELWLSHRRKLFLAVIFLLVILCFGLTQFLIKISLCCEHWVNVVCNLGRRCATCCWRNNWDHVWLQVSLLAVLLFNVSFINNTQCVYISYIWRDSLMWCFLKAAVWNCGWKFTIPDLNTRIKHFQVSCPLLLVEKVGYFTKPPLVKKTPLTVFFFSKKFLI